MPRSSRALRRISILTKLYSKVAAYARTGTVSAHLAACRKTYFGRLPVHTRLTIRAKCVFLIVQRRAFTFPDFIHTLPDAQDIIGVNTDRIEHLFDLPGHKISLIVVAAEPVIGIEAGISKPGSPPRLASH